MAMVVGLLIVIGLIGWGIGELVNAAAHGEPPIVGLLLLALPIYAVARALVDAVGPRLVRGWRYGGGNVQRLGAAVAVWLLVSAGLAVGVPQFVPSQRPDTALVAALGPACHGTAVAGAGLLDRTGSRANHLVVLDSDGNAHPWTGYPPMAWRPPNLADTELVACISAEEIKTEIQVCHYVNGPPIHRYRISREVRIIEAATGRVVSQFTV
ncbi:MAG TPA: hypothetical protein VH741_04570, partial [Candidatus Limnocylindrales bacterium]